MRISACSSDVCSSYLIDQDVGRIPFEPFCKLRKGHIIRQVGQKGLVAGRAIDAIDSGYVGAGVLQQLSHWRTETTSGASDRDAPCFKPQPAMSPLPNRSKRLRRRTDQTCPWPSDSRDRKSTV